MHKTIMAVMIIAVLASACAVRVPGVRVSAPGVEIGIEGGGDGGGHGSGFCPPGQAKKGNC